MFTKISNTVKQVELIMVAQNGASEMTYTNLLDNTTIVCLMVPQPENDMDFVQSFSAQNLDLTPFQKDAIDAIKIIACQA
jgi:hypothetical protein